MTPIPTIDLHVLSTVTGGADQPQPQSWANRLGQVAGNFAAGGVGQGAAALANGGRQPQQSPPQGLSPIQSGMNGLAVRERLDNKGI